MNEFEFEKKDTVEDGQNTEAEVFSQEQNDAVDTSVPSESQGTTDNVEAVPQQWENTSSQNGYAQQPYGSFQNQVPPTYVPPYAAYTAPNPFGNDADANNPIRYSTVTPVADKNGDNKGLRVFCILMAMVVLLTGGCLTGFFIGKNSSSETELYGNVELDLAAKPKDTDQSTAAQVYEQINPAIVGIRIYNEKGQSGEASGVIYSKEGYIITNDHIYSSVGAPQFKVYTYDGRELDAEYVGGDLVSDLAVLKIKETKDIKPAALGNSDEIYCGEQVVAISRNSGATLKSNITQGIISLTKRRVSNASNYSVNLIQTDTALNPGSSGGALVNMYGQIIGITVSKLSGEQYDRIGFAIPTTTVKWVVEQIIKSGKVTDRAKLGITYTMVDSITAEINDIDAVGLYISTVSDDSDLYGKVSEGDIITHINDTEIVNDDLVLNIIEKCRAGDVIRLTVYTTKGETKQYKVKLMTNMGTSSYTKEIVQEQNGNSSGHDGTFDFPFGE